MTLAKCFRIGLIVLLVNTAYVAAFASPTVFYMGNVALHLLLGIALTIAAAFLIRRNRALGAFVVSGVIGIVLAIARNTRDHHWVLWLHILLAFLAVAMLTMRWVRPVAAFAILFPAAVLTYNHFFPNPYDRIRNPLVVPVSMQEEGGGPKSPFFPSSSRTNVGGTIPSNFFMDSKTCGECHKDIYEQWNSSAHHFASFNNQFYRKSIEHMQDAVGTKPSKWCAGCHDHAVFFNGRFDRPIKEQVDTPEAQTGLGCMSCHSIVHVDSSMGNGGFTIAYPPLHELAGSKNPMVHAANEFLTYLNPAPHRNSFMKPFMREDAAEFCSTCHKVHLDVPVNNYRWMRGFNDYDNWQASGVSGQGARSFYYPPQSKTCGGCHMPLAASRDPGNRDGQVHSHRFPAANMALATVNHDEAQRKATEAFLTSGFVTVDIFAISPAVDRPGDTKMIRRVSDAPQAMTGFAAGEETEQAGSAVIRDVGRVAAPIDRAGATLEPGRTARVDVVVRTRTIGHFFPAGTVDAFDVWLELQGVDARGQTIFWSGRVEDGGKGPVEPGAHFYRSFQLDGEGNPINKRNAFQARSLLYARLIPPGAADVAHFLVGVPADAHGPIAFTAKLNYRKFSHYYTQFAYEGLTPPDLPIVTVARTKAIVPLGQPSWQSVAQKQDRERWNDWGIGLLLQGDLKGAEYAFRRVTEAEPGYADGWLNVARALIQEGETEAAKPFVQKALAIDAGLGRIYFFRAMIEKSEGDYDGALRSLRTVEEKYPRDRVVLNQIARVLFLKRDYTESLAALQRVCLVDPEDLQMHYTMMLCYRGLGEAEKAAREEKLFRRFKAEESSQSITAKRRMLSPEDNNERQAIHDHENSR
ncbi:MAG: tetratricopeptide repeat protein [Bryobacteraceae bacterium]